MSIPLFDAHCDTSFRLVDEGFSLRSNKGHIDLLRGGKYSPRVQMFAIWNEGQNMPGKYRAQIENLKKEFNKNSDIISLCTCKEQAVDAIDKGKTAAFISVEGAELLDCSEVLLERAAKDGICAVNLTWNYENELSGSNDEGSRKGLTDKGKSFVKKCEELKVFVDVSHISEPAFWDVIEIAKRPVIASHSNSKALFPHKRNLTDEQFKAIKNTGGVVGINLYAEFLSEFPTVETVMEHIEHFLAMGGEKNVGIGADFDGCDRLPDGICGVEDMEKIYNGLLRRNYSEKLVDDIFFNNFFDIFN